MMVVWSAVNCVTMNQVIPTFLIGGTFDSKPNNYHFSLLVLLKVMRSQTLELKFAFSS